MVHLFLILARLPGPSRNETNQFECEREARAEENFEPARLGFATSLGMVLNLDPPENKSGGSRLTPLKPKVGVQLLTPLNESGGSIDPPEFQIDPPRGGSLFI